MARRCLILVVLLAMAALMTACGESKSTSASAAKAPASPSPPAPAKDAAEDVFVASGPIVVENQVDVAAQREGMVAQVLVDTDARVHKGQVLALLDDRQISADHDAAAAKTRSIAANLKNWEAEFKVLQTDLVRAQKMWDAQLITKQDLEHAEYKVVADQYEVERERESLRNAQAVQRSLELELGKTRVRAPFDGIVARRYVRAGQRVAMGDRLFWVTAVKPLRVKFTLPERFFGRVQRGQQLTVTSLASGDQKHMAKVIEVSPVVDPSSGTIEVQAQVVGDTADLRPGMNVNIRIAKP